MTVRPRRVWRVSSGTRAVVWVFVALAGIGVPALAVGAWLRSGELAISIFLLVLAAGAVVYGWRFGLRPRLVASPEGVEVVNPGRRTAIPWDELTLIAPGENGLVLAPRSHGPRPGASRSPSQLPGRAGRPERTRWWPSWRIFATTSTRRWRTT
jgi:hypothetical protein